MSASLWAGFPQQKPKKKTQQPVKKKMVVKSPPIYQRRRPTQPPHHACKCPSTKTPVVYSPPILQIDPIPEQKTWESPPFNPGEPNYEKPKTRNWWQRMFAPTPASDSEMSGNPFSTINVGRGQSSFNAPTPVFSAAQPAKSSSSWTAFFKTPIPTVPTFRPISSPTFAQPTYAPTVNTVYATQPKQGTSLKLNQIFEGGLALTSQWLSAYGKNPSTQVGNYGAVQPAGQLQQQGYTPEQIAQIQAYQAQQAGLGSQAGSAVGSGIDGVLGWAQQNFWLVAGGGVALFLLFRQPPGSRR